MSDTEMLRIITDGFSGVHQKIDNEFRRVNVKLEEHGTRVVRLEERMPTQPCTDMVALKAEKEAAKKDVKDVAKDAISLVLKVLLGLAVIALGLDRLS